MDFQFADIVIGIAAGLMGSLGGYRLLWFALERKLDDRYLSKETGVDLRNKIRAQENDTQALEERMANAEHGTALVMKDLQYITTHINERVLTTLESITNELREMRRDQEKHAVVQERHTTTMEQHSKSLNAFQNWVVNMSASRIPVYPTEGGPHGQ